MTREPLLRIREQDKFAKPRIARDAKDHGKQAQTEDAPFKRAKKIIATSSLMKEDSAIVFFAGLKGASSV